MVLCIFYYFIYFEIASRRWYLEYFTLIDVGEARYDKIGINIKLKLKGKKNSR